MTQSSLQNKRVTHSSMFAEVHFTNASSLPQIPMQCMHCKMLANICMSLLKLIFLWSFPDVSWASLDSDHDITNNAMQVRIHPWTWFWLGFVLTAFIKPDLSIQLSKAVREPQWGVGLWKNQNLFARKDKRYQDETIGLSNLIFINLKLCWIIDTQFIDIVNNNQINAKYRQMAFWSVLVHLQEILEE